MSFSAEPPIVPSIAGVTPLLRRGWRGWFCGPLALQLAMAAGCLPLAGQARPEAPACPAPESSAAEATRRQLDPLLKPGPPWEVVLLGEIHTDPADHTWQLQMLETLLKHRQPLVLGLEMVPAARQPSLTRWSNGQLDGAGFLAEVEWSRIWGHDPELYWPLLRWARQRGVPMVALNLEPAVVRRVRREGLAAIPQREREGIGLPAPVGDAYRRQLTAAWQAHQGLAAGAGASPKATDAADLERFISSQLLRDRAMAERIAAARRRDPGRLVVALVGRGHLGEEGLPAQLRHLGMGRVLTLQRPEPPEGCGPPPPRARLGAYLESAGGAVWVRRVAPGTAAAAAGLRAGDRVMAVNGTPVERAGQVIRRVREQPSGSPLRLLIERAGRRRQLEIWLESPPVEPPGTMGG